MSARAPEISDVIRKMLDRSIEDLRVACPATVQSYDPATQLVSVRPDLKTPVENADGSIDMKAIPVIPNVPVCFPGGDGFALTFPLAPGDTVLLVFADRSIDRWIEQGGLTDPGFTHLHHFADAFAIPGARNLKNALSSAASDRIRLGKDGGPTVDVTSSDVILDGGNAGVGRVGDSVSVTIPPGTVVVSLPTLGLVPNPNPIVVTGTITSGAPHVKA